MIPLKKARELNLTTAKERALRYAAERGYLKATKLGRDWFATARAIREYENSPARRHRSITKKND